MIYIDYCILPAGLHVKVRIKWTKDKSAQQETQVLLRDIWLLSAFEDLLECFTSGSKSRTTMREPEFFDRVDKPVPFTDDERKEFNEQ